jgi:hypothetical protein
MFAHSAVAAVSDRRRRSEIDATIRALKERPRQPTALCLLLCSELQHWGIGSCHAPRHQNNSLYGKVRDVSDRCQEVYVWMGNYVR